MKNRKLLYILAPATFLIWGAIVFSILGHFGHSDNFPEKEYLPIRFQDADTLDDSYTLLVNYRDPFGTGTIKRTATTSNPVKKAPVVSRRTSRRSQIRSARIAWPNIEYSGLILNDDKQVALIRINNSNLLMSEGEEKQNIKLLKMYADSARLLYKNKEKTFTKN